MRTGEGKTLVATLAGLPERAARQGHAHRHGQRVPRAARRRLDGADLQLPRHVGRRRQGRPVVGGEARRVRLRHHLRHQQRVRLRLPARQPRVPHRRPHAARPRVRDRRRSRLDPHRRGAHAADHLGPRRGKHRALPEDQRARAAPEQAGRGRRRGRLLGRREDQAGVPLRRGPRARRGAVPAGGAAAAKARASTTRRTSA